MRQWHNQWSVTPFTEGAFVKSFVSSGVKETTFEAKHPLH